MQTGIIHLRLLSLRERYALMALRCAGPESGGAFARLAGQARSAGFEIGAAAAPYAGPDERRLLGWLALLQRQRPDRDLCQAAPFGPKLFATLRDCAALLDEAGCRLDYRNAHRLRGGGDLHQQAAPARPMPTRAGATQASILRFVSERGAVPSRELMAIGASRQMLRTMCKAQMLQRTGRGLYAIDGIDAAARARADGTGHRHAALAGAGLPSSFSRNRKQWGYP